MNPDRVRHVRTYLQWSQAELAVRVGTTQPKISQMEKGLYTSAELLTELVALTGYSRSWFERGPLPDLPTGSLMFRKQASSRRADDERVRAHVRQAAEILELFGDLPQAPPVRLTALEPGTPLDLDAVEVLARTCREQLGVGQNDPIPNLVRAVERCGVVVVGSVTDIEKHGGASFWREYPFGRPIICVTRGMSGDRQRFTTAHELGHLVLHQFKPPQPDVAEQQAHRFAGALLLPQEQAREWIEPPVTLRALAKVKQHWGISIRALVKRSLDLRLISDDQRTSLEKQVFARGWGRQEPVEVPYERPVLLRRLIEEATGLPLAGAAAKLGLPVLAVRDLVA